MRNKIFILIMSIIYVSGLHSQNIIGVTPLSMEVGLYEKYELLVALNASYTNPYDYEQIAVKAVFMSQSGRQDTIEGFFLQNFDLNPSTGTLTTKGAGEWRIRYTPTEKGEWTYTVWVQTPSGNSSMIKGGFSCMSSPTKGFIRRNTSNYLQFDTGEQYIPIGQNLCWNTGNPYLTYKNWLEKMGSAQANFMRFWLCHWGLGLEWRNDVNTGYSGLKRYKQNNAWYLDELIEKCREQGIYMMFCINYHGQVSTQVNPNWSENPYNTANGGMCAQPQDFFNNAAAKAAHKNRLRYIVARWGYSPQIMTWELFNEVNWTDNYNTATVKTDVRNWHEEMAQYLRKIDPFKHLISTSFAKDDDALIWASPQMDYTQTHNYLSVPNIEKAISTDNLDFLKKYNKPVINSEFGIDVGSGTGTQVADPKGIHFHNTLWATAFSGAMGAAATWWWDSYIDPQNLYKEFTPLSNIIKKLALKDDNYQPFAVQLSGGGGGQDFSISPSADWGQATENSFIVNANGISAGKLGQYLYGSSWNTGYRNPPTFKVNYIVGGQFKVKTAGSASTSPRISIYLDGNLVLNVSANINQTYMINVPSGEHTIKVDNLGTDWIRVAEYVFSGVGVVPINAYVLKASSSDKITGWLHNSRYNWKEIQTAIPPSVSAAQLTIADVLNGAYDIQFYDCSTGVLFNTIKTTVINQSLSFTIPPLAWDMAFIATRSNTVGTQDKNLSEVLSIRAYPNPVRRGESLNLDMIVPNTSIKGVLTGKWQLQMIHLNGQVVYSRSVDFSEVEPLSIPTDDLSQGIYIIHLMNGSKILRTKVHIIQ